MSKISDVQAKDILKVMRDNNVGNEAKITLLNDLKSSLKRVQLPDAAIGPVFEIVRLCLLPQHSALFTMGFSTLQNLLKRLHCQEPDYIIPQTPRLLPLVVERLGDPKERHRELARQCLTDIWKVCPQEVEEMVRDSALSSKNPKAKDGAMQWISQVHQEHGLHFKLFVPKLMDALEDADGTVRERAKITVVDLFQSAEGHAKADLKRQLIQRNVRKTIADYILERLSVPDNIDLASSTQPPSEERPSSSHRSIKSNKPSSHSTITPSDASNTFTAAEKEQGTYLHTQKELENIFRDMQLFFEGKESEGNWSTREKSVVKLIKVTHGNAPNDFTAAYLAGIKSLLDGLLKTVNSLRTTVSTNGCHLVQEIAKASGAGLDPMVEILLQSLIKLCGGTKKISAANGDATVNAILANVSYSLRLLQHIWGACTDKNIQPRKYATGWLRTIIRKHGSHRNHIDHSGGTDLMQKSITRGLEDSDKDVRESMRQTYWMFAALWPERAESIMSALSANYKKLLENHPANPNPPEKGTPTTTAGSKPSFSRSTSAVPGKPSLKEVLAQQKAAQAAARAKAIPPRPGSSLSTFSPEKIPSTAVAGGLSSKPVRPMKSARRVEIARPATADPYSVRRNPNKTETPAATPAMSGARKKPTKLPSPTNSPSKSAARQQIRRAESPLLLSRNHPRQATIPDSPTKADEELTMVLPHLRGGNLGQPLTSGQSEMNKGEALRVFEDPTAMGPRAMSPGMPPGGAVLTDLTLNEPNNLNVPTIARQPEPRKPDTVDNATVSKERDSMRRLVRSGIARIETDNLDIQGYRKLQKIIKDQLDIWQGDVPFGSLLTALLQALDRPFLPAQARTDSRGGGLGRSDSRGKERLTVEAKKALDLRSQALGTVRTLLNVQQRLFAPYLTSALCSLISSHHHYDSSSHIMASYDAITEELVKLAEPEPTIEALLAQLEGDDSMSSQHGATTRMRIDILNGLMASASSQELVLPSTQIQRLGAFTVKALKSTDPDIRRSIVNYSTELHNQAGEGFWDLLREAPEPSRNVVAWALAKKGQLQMQR